MKKKMKLKFCVEAGSPTAGTRTEETKKRTVSKQIVTVNLTESE